MSEQRHRRRWAELLGAAAAIAAGAEIQRRHLRRIASDPEQAVLQTPPHGDAVGVRSADGTQLHVELFRGSGDGPTFVLGHGWTEMLSFWIYVIRGLRERGFNVAAYDLRGHGQSEPAADGDYSIDRFGEDLDAVLESVVPAGDRAIVVGHSLGAMAIAAWAEHHDVARRACAAALLNTGLGELLTESLVIPIPMIARGMNRVLPPSAFVGSRAPIPRFSTPVTQAIVRYAAFGPAATPAQIAYYERMLVSCPPRIRSEVGVSLSELELHHALPRLNVPTLVLAGEVDRLTPPSHAKRIAQELPQLHRLIVLEDTAHMAPLERPGAVIKALAELASVSTGTTATAA